MRSAGSPRQKLVVALVALALSAAACGGVSSDDEAADASNQTSTESAAETTLPADSENADGAALADGTADPDGAAVPEDTADPDQATVPPTLSPDDLGLGGLLEGLSDDELAEILADLGLPGVTASDLDSLNLQDLNLEDLNLEEFGLGNIELDPNAFPDAGTIGADLAANPAVLGMLQQILGINEEQAKCMAEQFDEMSSSNIDIEKLRQNDCGVDMSPLLPPG